MHFNWCYLGLVGLWFPPGLKLPIRVAVSGFMSMGDCGPILDILGYKIENRSNWQRKHEISSSQCTLHRNAYLL